MLASELRDAARRVADLLGEADILSSVRQFRGASGNDRVIAAARLGHAGAMLVEHGERLTAAELAVVRHLRLESLISSDYWRDLLEHSDDATETNAELVHLYSRAMFAGTHLPNLLGLLDMVDAPVATEGGAGARSKGTRTIASQTAVPFVVRLVDAGERAADPDRVARAIDGIDMLYAACASMAGPIESELSLERIGGDDTRDLYFDGEPDVLVAVASVVASIPEALHDAGDDPHPDLDALVASLPVFEALGQWAGDADLDDSEIEDIRETLHQGVLLTMESGSLLHRPVSHGDERGEAGSATEPKRVAAASGSTKEDESRGNRAADDEHYRRYLRERSLLIEGDETMPGGKDSEARRRRDAVHALLDSLGRTRSARS